MSDAAESTTTAVKRPTWASSNPGGYVPVKKEHLLVVVQKHTQLNVDVANTNTNNSNENKDQEQKNTTTTAADENTTSSTTNADTNNMNNHEDDDVKSTTTTTTAAPKSRGMWTGSERANPTAGAEKTERPTFEGELNFMDRIGIQKTKHITKAKNEFAKVSQSMSQTASNKIKALQAKEGHKEGESKSLKTPGAVLGVDFQPPTLEEENQRKAKLAEDAAKKAEAAATATNELPERRVREEGDTVNENKPQNDSNAEETKKTTENNNNNQDAATVATASTTEATSTAVPTTATTEKSNDWNKKSLAQNEIKKFSARDHISEILRLRHFSDEPVDVRRKRLFDNQLILAPLTTVGNLPFRRICKEWGADVTCGEMALSYNLNQLQKSEWSLLRRHESEDKFGLQIAASRGSDAAMTSALLHEMDFSYDFLDLNCCCPVKLICDHGCGCALFDRKNRMREVVQNMYHFQSKAVTIKSLIGPDEKNPNLHRQIAEYESWGAESVILHGRSYRQRYTKIANWDYIDQCAKLTRLPLIGNGDILSWEDVVERKQFCPEVSGLMIGRGALVKPWIFEEIKQQKTLDISSHERFELLKKYCKYGMAHWGADEKGIATTRKFMLEWLSFMCRYVPVGLMETLPQRINDRPPLFQGRDDMETLMSSDNVKDWIKLSEMILGPVGDKFHFTPKHKSNAYSITDAEKKEMMVAQVGSSSSAGEAAKEAVQEKIVEQN